MAISIEVRRAGAPRGGEHDSGADQHRTDSISPHACHGGFSSLGCGA